MRITVIVLLSAACFFEALGWLGSVTGLQVSSVAPAAVATEHIMQPFDVAGEPVTGPLASSRCFAIPPMCSVGARPVCICPDLYDTHCRWECSE